LPPTFDICRFRGFAAGAALEPLISNFRRSRAPVAPVYAERASRPLVGNRTRRGSGFFEPRARAIRGSSLLGKGPGHLMPTVASTVLRCGCAFSGAAAAHVVGDVGGRTVGEFRKTRHPRNVKFDKVLETCFSGAGNDFRKPGTYEAPNSRMYEVRES
jgi:hypothetical protein